MNRVKRFNIKVNGQNYEVEVEEVGETAARDRAKTTQPSFDQAPAGQNGAKKIVAPMPGVITAVKVKAGEVVLPEQAVLTLEAMKMENEIPAGRAGQVKEILVSVGQSVSSGELLLILE